jgi:hypothetical protein
MKNSAIKNHIKKEKKVERETVNQIAAVLENYFQGIYSGDVQLLQHVFHIRCTLFGDINNERYLKSLDEYLNVVKNRKSPKELGETFRMEIVSIDVLRNIAYAKVHVPMFDFNYYDYLSLLRNDQGAWQIVNKLFTHVE